jgi:protein-disulfide isomerase
LSVVDKSRTEYLYKILIKNRVGSQATDFSFITSQKESLTLYSIEADELILVFYDPECEHCAEIINRLKYNTDLNKKILSGKTKVLAVYPDGDRMLWEKSYHKLPNNWIAAFASSPIQPMGKYVFRALPSIYILDKNKKVIAKDITTL